MTEREASDLLHAMKGGSEGALEKLFMQYHKYLVVIAYQYLSDNHAAKDATQDVFLDLWNRRSTLEITSSLKSYLRRAVVNRSLAKMRKDKNIQFREGTDLPETPTTEGGNKDHDHRALENIIHQSIDKLPERCREVFKLSRFENLSHKEIAARLDISTKTIENQMTKALKFIRKELKDYGVLGLLYFLINF